MNKQRLKTIEELKESLEDIHEKLEDIQEDLRTVKEEEEEYFENIPENLKESERAVSSSDYIDNLEECLTDLQNGMECIENVINYLDL